MSEREHFADDAAGIAALPSSDPERVAAEAHARHCPPCGRALDESREMLALLEALPPPPPPSMTVTAKVIRMVTTQFWLERADQRAPALLTVLAWLTFAMLAKQHARNAASWALSAIVLGVALTSTIVAQRGRGHAAAFGALATSGLLVLLAAASEGLSVRVGIKCTLIELIAAALPYGAVVYVAVQRALEVSAARYAAVAAAGALVGHAALHITCPVRTESAHLMCFHFGGVVLATLLGTLCAGFLRRRGSFAGDVQ